MSIRAPLVFAGIAFLLGSGALAGGPSPSMPYPAAGAADVGQSPVLTWEFAPASLGCSALYVAAQPGGGTGNPQVSVLHRVDPSNGATTAVGPIGYRGVGAMTFGPDGVLYATTAGEDPPGSNPQIAFLISIDITTGAGTFIAQIGSGANPEEVYRVLDLTTGPDSNVYGIGLSIGEGRILFRLNTSTGATARVGSVEGVDNTFASALDFAPSGVLNGLLFTLADPNVRLATIDPLSGVFTPGAVPTGLVPSDFAAAAEHCPFTGDFYFIERQYSPNAWRLIRCDPVTGVSTLNVPMPTGADALVFNPNIVSYDVYLDTNNPPTTLVCDDAAMPVCDPGDLARCTTYFWRVVADVNGVPVEGPVWSFTTGFFTNADVNGDGVVDFLDLNILLSDFGLGPNCPPLN